MIDAHREWGDKISPERRLYVSSLPPEPVLFATSGRTHWGIENSLHYVLDIVFREDGARIKGGEVRVSAFKSISLYIIRIYAYTCIVSAGIYFITIQGIQKVNVDALAEKCRRTGLFQEARDDGGVGRYGIEGQYQEPGKTDGMVR